ncbi:MAG: methyltransferase domain-containing protein [Candidatus Aenigmatarchaeota archaeon]
MSKHGVPNVFRRMIGYHDSIYDMISPHLNGGDVLSVGCGEGRMEAELKERTGVNIEGLEVTKYKKSRIPIKLFDGKKLPVKDKSYETVLFVYMLHHTPTPKTIENMLKEAKRVARKDIIILDHIYTNSLSKALLMVYDYTSNVLYDMPIPLNFLKIKEWGSIFTKLNLKVEEAEIPTPMNVFFKVKV